MKFRVSYLHALNLRPAGGHIKLFKQTRERKIFLINSVLNIYGLRFNLETNQIVCNVSF